MPSSPYTLLHYLRMAVGACREDARSDTELLARFAETRDEMAFAVLVWRHGTLVWGTCRRILGDTPDAEDAFQATFLDLAREAGRSPIRSFAGWLHQVARRTAIDLRSKSRRSEDLGRRLWAAAQPVQENGPDRAELYAALDEELVDLPEKLRIPLVLRYLDGKTQNEVASILGCSRTAALKRLARGEALLRQRLERRGLSVGAGALAALLGGATAASAMPASLAHSTVKAALTLTSAPAARGVLLAWAACWARIIRIFGVGKPLPLVLGVAAIGAVLTGVSVWAYQHRHADPLPSATLPPASAVVEKPGQPEVPRLDLFGEPLPDHAVARMGMARFLHAGPVSSVAYAPDARTIASASADKTIRLWDAVTGKELRKLVGHGAAVGAVVFSPDGKTLASAGADKTVRLWDAATGRELRRLKGHQQAVTDVTFSPSGKELISASYDRSVRIWDAATGRELRRLEGHTGQVCAVVVSADGQTVASAGADQSIRLWNARSGEETRKLEGHTGAIYSLVFSPDAKTLASSDVEGTIRLWEVATGRGVRTLQARSSPGHQRVVSALAFAPDGQTLVSGSYDWTIRFWDVNRGVELRSLGTPLSHFGHYAHLTRVSSLAFSRDGKSLVSGGWEGAVRRWEVATGKRVHHGEGHQESIGSVVFSPDGKTLVSASTDNTVRLWDAATGRQLRQMNGPPDSIFYAVAFSPNGKTLATGSHDRAIRLWDAATGREVRKLLGHTDEATMVAFSPDGKTLASAGTDRTIRLWNLATGEELSCWKTPTWIVSLAFSPDGKTLALGELGLTIALRDVATGREIRKLEGHRDKVKSVAFSPDGKALVSASRDGTVRIWDVAVAKGVRRLEGHEGEVLSVAFAPQGRYVASAGEDGTVRLWERSSGRECGKFTGHEGHVCSVAFSPDGRRLASSGVDHTVLVWNLTGQSDRAASAARPGEENLERLWSELASEDAARAYRAGWLLASVPDQAVDLFRRRLRGSLKPADPPRFFLERDVADYPGLKVDEPVKPPMSEELRIARAVSVLERIGSSKARELLRELDDRARQAQTNIDRELSRAPE
jgi:RNA polymerase sigma factor (sigma-70 family)